VPAFVFTLGPTQSSVSEIRTTDDGLDETIEQARRLVAENGHTRSTWTVGPSCRPIGLATNLRARGFVPAMPPLEHSLTAMALVKPPPAPPDGVAAKLVTDFDEYVAAHRISLAGFAVSDDVAAQQLAALPDMWKRYDGVNRFAHLVFVDGRPIGSSFTSPARSASCSTAVPSCPRLAAAAPTGRSSPRAGPGPWNSRNLRSSFRRAPCRAPILERCGFQPICVLDLLDDSAVAPAAAA
jgi:hypothetical protein